MRARRCGGDPADPRFAGRERARNAWARRPALPWLAAIAFALSLVGSAGCWRSAIGLCGGRTTLADATARYGAGSLVNTFVPARAGDAVRLALFSRLVPGERKIWTTGGAFVAVAAARAAVLGVLVAAGSVFGVVPWWPSLVAVGLVVAAALLARRARRHLELRDIASLTAWVLFSVLGRFAGAAAISVAIGIHRPLVAALLILPALMSPASSRSRPGTSASRAQRSLSPSARTGSPSTAGSPWGSPSRRSRPPSA